MELTMKQIIDLANRAYPKKRSIGVSPQTAFVKGYCCALRQMKLPSPSDDGEDFLTAVATGLRNLWPQGEKGGKYPWRDSVPNLVKRLEFVWKERDLGDKYTVEDCLRAGRRYLSQFQDNTKYMQILKYFVFKQERSVSQKDGKITCIYSSKFADFLEDSANFEDCATDVSSSDFETVNTVLIC